MKQNVLVKTWDSLYFLVLFDTFDIFSLKPLCLCFTIHNFICKIKDVYMVHLRAFILLMLILWHLKADFKTTVYQIFDL